VFGVSVLQPFSRGTVRLAGPTAATPPIIDPNYFGDDHDLVTMVEGLGVARRIGGPARGGVRRSWYSQHASEPLWIPQCQSDVPATVR
jgi:hypothetical protein